MSDEHTNLKVKIIKRLEDIEGEQKISAQLWSFVVYNSKHLGTNCTSKGQNIIF